MGIELSVNESTLTLSPTESSIPILVDTNWVTGPTFANDSSGNTPLYYITATITSPSPTANFQQMAVVNSNANTSYYGTTLSNVNWQDGKGNILDSWLESGETKTSTASVYWVKIPTSSLTKIYQVLYGTAQTSLDGSATGAEPNYTGTYGQYDNGAQVFNFYDDFAGNTLNAEWDISRFNYQVSNGFIGLPNGGVATGTSAVTFNANIIADYGVNLDTVVGFPGAPSVWQLGRSGDTVAPTHQIGISGSDQLATSVGVGYVSIPSSGMVVLGIYENVGTTTAGFLYQTPSGQYTYTTHSYATLPTENLYLGWAYSGYNNFPTIQWVRVRQYPPNGIMPSTSFSSIAPA